MSDIVTKAREFVIAAHGAQERKYIGEPYVVHTHEVADIVERVGGTPEMIAAVHLHDVVEIRRPQRKTSFASLDRCCRPRRLPNRSNPALAWKQESPQASRIGPLRRLLCRRAAIKLADIISNVRSIAEHDHGFARVYVAELRYLVEKLARQYGTARAGAHAVRA